jgi:hypothetical protein
VRDYGDYEGLTTDQIRETARTDLRDRTVPGRRSQSKPARADRGSPWFGAATVRMAGVRPMRARAALTGARRELDLTEDGDSRRHGTVGILGYGVVGFLGIRRWNAPAQVDARP